MYQTIARIGDAARRIGLDAILLDIASGQRGAPVIGVEMPGASVAHADLRIPVPGTSEALAPLLHTVRAQQLALELSLALGIDPDAPFGLSKVTRTG